MSLAEYVSSSGITTYEKLLIVCERQFVVPPDRAKFDALVGGTKSNPVEGVAVILPDPEEGAEETEDPEVEFPTVMSQRSRRRKRGLPDPTQNEPAPPNAPTEDHEEV